LLLIDDSSVDATRSPSHHHRPLPKAINRRRRKKKKREKERTNDCMLEDND
jgi:hypothetical protein